MVPVGPEKCARSIKAQRVCDKNDEEGYAIAIEVFGAKVVSLWIKVATHVVIGLLAVLEGCRRDRRVRAECGSPHR